MKIVNCLKDFKPASCSRPDNSGATPGKAAQIDLIIVPEYWCGGTTSKGGIQLGLAELFIAVTALFISVHK